MTSSSIEAAAQWLGKLALEEVQFLGEVSSKVEELKSELEWMQCFLMDADEKQNKNILIRKWVSEIRDLAFSAEDLIESYILTVQYQKQEGFINYLKWLASFWMDALTLHYIGSNLDALTAKISKMTSRLQSYGVKSSYDTNSSHVFMTKKLLAEQRRTYSHVEDHDVVGIKDCVTCLAGELLGTKKIVVIHGMGGIGKSTLARELLNHSPVKDHFAGSAWAYISQQLQLGQVCREILLQLIPESDTERRSVVQGLQDSQLPGKLYEMLKLQNYLIVLDDIWFVGAWMSLAPAFPLDDVASGSKLLITTRNRDMLSVLSNDLVFYYKVELLNPDWSWELLERKSNFQRDGSDPPMIELGQKMLDHCNGHPLAIAVLGGVLATKTSYEEWQSVLDNLTFHLQRDELYGGVYEILALSYNALPYNTKPCFLHLINFPEDFDIPLDKLYHLWIADGIFSSTQEQFTRNRSLEEIAEVYLMDLVQKSMVQLGAKNLNGQITICHLHDLLRDKGLEIIKEENFLRVIDLQSNANVQQVSKGGSGSKMFRRLSIFVGPEVASSINEALSEISSNLRSLVFFPAGEDSEVATSEWIVSVCEDHPLLRVFDLEGLRITGSLPCEIGNLIYLRYLSLKDTQLTELPPSITKLKCLVILDLRVKGSIKLPNLLWKLKSLKQLYFPTRHITQVVIRDQPYKIEEVDDGLLDLNDMGNLEKLEGLNLDKLKRSGLENLSNLRKVYATCASNKDNLVLFLNTPNIKLLHLALDACIIAANPMLLSTCAALQVLYLDAQQGLYSPLPVMPQMYHENLVHLDISFCTMEVDPMPVLEQLPKLISLALHVCYRGSKLMCTSPKAFPELTYLAFDGLFHLKKWTVANGGLAKLRTLYVGDCALRMLPQVLPEEVVVTCNPCVHGGLERYGGCTHVNANQDP